MCPLSHYGFKGHNLIFYLPAFQETKAKRLKREKKQKNRSAQWFHGVYNEAIFSDDYLQSLYHHGNLRAQRLPK